MPQKQLSRRSKSIILPKAPTGIRGLDEITGGGLPKGRPTLVAGSAGAGKTLFAMEFLVCGATEFGEPGVFITFEETTEELAKNVQSLGFDLKALQARKMLVLDHVRIERSEIEETGEYDLDGLFVRIGYAIDQIGAKRIALDTLEALFGGLSDTGILRAELRRLFRWLKDKGITAVITAEQGIGTLTRHGLEEYVSDAVIALDHRTVNQLSTRHLRVVKYRGSAHGTNEYPFLIDEHGFEVLPITSVGLNHAVSTQRISSGVPRLDTMLSGKGYYRGSTVLISGGAGTGKSSLAAHFVDAACRRGEKSLYFAFEESPDQIIRNMRSIGIDLEPWVNRGLLRFESVRPTFYGLEMHLAKMYQAIRDFEPQVVVVDPITDMITIGSALEVKAMLMRLVDFIKGNGITAVFISLTGGGEAIEQSEAGISSLIDTWILLRELETNGERTRGLYILKSRGMAHSSQIREFRLTDHGVELVDVYIGPGGVLTGTARITQESRDHAAADQLRLEAERQLLALDQKRKSTEAQIAALRAELTYDEAQLAQAQANAQRQAVQSAQARDELAEQRGADADTRATHPRKSAARRLTSKNSHQAR